MEKAKTDELIYKNANQYRLHADNLRWTLLGGYAAFIVAILSLSKSNIDIINNAIFYLLLFAVSWGYFWILAVQNWFYNLFARFVDDCENRLTLGKNLQTLKSFAQKKRKYNKSISSSILYSRIINRNIILLLSVFFY